MSADIIRLKQEIEDAKSKHEDASKDVKRIEKEMADFGKNRGGKLAELESSLDKLKTALRKSLEAVKPLQQERRETEIDLEQCRSDLTSAQEALAETELNLGALQEEIDSTTAERTAIQVCNPVSRIDLSSADIVFRASMIFYRRSSTTSGSSLQASTRK